MVNHATKCGNREGYQYWNNCCDASGGSGKVACQWKNKEVIRYSATCSGDGDYTGLALNMYLTSGESVQVLPSGTSYGFFYM